MLAGLFLKKFKNYSTRAKRSLLGGLGLAGSWRNRSSSLVGLARLAGMGIPTVAKGRGTLAGQRLEEDQSPGALPQGPWGTRRKRELELLLRGERHPWSVVLPHAKALQPCLPWTVSARLIFRRAASCPAMWQECFKMVLTSCSVFHSSEGRKNIKNDFLTN